MSEISVRKALLQGVLDAGITVPIKWENAAFTTPNASPWAAVYILGMTDEPATLGVNGENLAEGVLQLSIFTPKGAGDLSAYTVADEFRQVFRTGESLSADGQVVRIRSASMRNGPAEPNWYSQIIDVEFYAYKAR